MKIKFKKPLGIKITFKPLLRNKEVTTPIGLFYKNKKIKNGR